jgi:hypothetical protein
VSVVSDLKAARVAHAKAMAESLAAITAHAAASKALGLSGPAVRAATSALSDPPTARQLAELARAREPAFVEARTLEAMERAGANLIAASKTLDDAQAAFDATYPSVREPR